MRTKREQFQAYHFVIQRIVAAMTTSHPDSLERPMRRTTLSVLGGSALAVLIFVGFWVVGLIFPAGNQNWKEEGSILVDGDSGAVYVYLDSTLFPVTNLASAKLLFSSGNTTVHDVTAADLEGEPRGWRIGIPDGPASLPEPDALVGLPWQVCTAPESDNPMRQSSHILLDAPATGEQLEDNGLLVRDEEADKFLIWNDLKFPVADDTTLLAMGFDPDAATAVDSIFIDAVALGPQLRAPEIEDDGEDADVLNQHDAAYGDLFSSGGQVYVLTVDGLAPIGPTTQVLLGDGELGSATSVSASVVSEVGTTSIEPEGFPQAVPSQSITPDGSAVCAVFSSDAVTVTVYPTPPDEITAPTAFSPPSGQDVTDTAEHVSVPGGSGALVMSQATPGAADGTVYLISDLGVKHALAGDALKLLGYGNVKPVPVPAGFVALVPTGPALDPDKARAQMP